MEPLRKQLRFNIIPQVYNLQGKDNDMQKKTITSEKNATAIARDKLTGRLGRDCFPVLPLHPTPDGMQTLIVEVRHDQVL